MFSADLLLLAPQDNCLVARCNLGAGAQVLLDGEAVTLPQAVPLGYKLARRALVNGDKVIRWGAPIGSATQPIARGALIHTDNLASDYLPTYLSEGEGSFVNTHAPHHAT